jgi:hypothetical protein
MLPLLAPGDALDATGRVGGSAASPRIDVSRASDIVRVGDPGPGNGTDPSDDPAAGPGGRLAAGDGRSTGLEPSTTTGLPTPFVLGGACAALASILGLALAARRRRARRDGERRVAARLAALSGDA